MSTLRTKRGTSTDRARRFKEIKKLVRPNLEARLLDLQEDYHEAMNLADQYRSELKARDNDSKFARIVALSVATREYSTLSFHTDADVEIVHSYIAERKRFSGPDAARDALDALTAFLEAKLDAAEREVNERAAAIAVVRKGST